MATVKQWDGWFGKIRWRVQVKYSARTEMFSIALPEPAHDHFGKELTAETQRAVIQDFHLKHQQFKDIACQKTQVILLELDAEDDHWSRGIRLVLRCGVFEKKVWPVVKGLHTNIAYEELDSSISEEAEFVDKMWANEANDCTELAWSAELEGQVAELVKAFILLRDKLKSICGNPDTLMKSLMTNTPLLSGELVKAKDSD